MSQKESTFLNMLITLVMVTGVAAVSLGFVHQWTKEPIKKAREEKQKRAIESVVGDYDNDPLVDAYEVCRDSKKGRGHRYQRRANCRHEHTDAAEMLTFYPASINQETQVTAISAFSENGYSGRIELMVGIDKSGVIRNIEVISHKETPGLGSKIKEEKFIDQFIGKTVPDFDLRVKKDGGNVDAISGATISSRAFSEAVQQAFDAFNQTKDEKPNEP